MEEKQVQLTEEQYIEQLLAAQADATQANMAQQTEQAVDATRAPLAVRVRHPRKRSPYRQWALLLAGIICYVLLVMLAALVWGSLVFMNQGDVAETAAMPLAFFMLAVFFSCAVVTMLSRGGTIFPTLVLAVIVNILPFLLAEAPRPEANAIAIRLLYTLLAAVAGFVVSKLLYIRSRG